MKKSTYVIQSALDTGGMVTAEDHQIHGGLGSAVAEVVSNNWPVPVEMVAVRDVFGESGEAQELLERFHLKDKDIVEVAKRVISRKKQKTV